MTSKEVREQFLKFFEERGHARVRSASLVPVEDPTLYFTNAGMVPFKNVFTGQEKRPYSRAASSQKCLRVSGKHNDLENVGRTPRHHTFFEMLGNFSFGDYFKKEAIRYAWEFLVDVMKLDPGRLWVTVYEEDEEAARLWRSEVKIPEERLLHFGKEDNFWSMGATGPCGPCSEIHYDHGKEYGMGPEDRVNGETDRFMEIWNLVFMQFDRDETGEVTPLPAPSIDTGMGLERLAAAVQGVHSNYDTDLFLPLIREIGRITQKNYGKDPEQDVSIRVIADHIRATAFLIADGVQPSNEGRGYVLRRILRRAVRHGRLLGMGEPFFYQLVGPLRKSMGKIYPELPEHQAMIGPVIQSEEERFLETLETGLKLIDEELHRHRKDKRLPGDVVFTLYDTYGFPADLTELIAEEKGFAIDNAGFEKRMQEQKERGRRAWKGTAMKKEGAAYEALLRSELKTEFVGYDRLVFDDDIAALVRQGSRIDEAREGEEVELVATRTPFYAESGGQVGDQGKIETDRARLTVLDTQKLGDALILHTARVAGGTVREGDRAHLSVDPEFREGAMLHHSATHLFHAALRQILGTHVRQAGSLVTPARLRFDFTHFQPVNPAELEAIEDLVNRQIRKNLRVTSEILPYDRAIASGALAFFGDKYGDQVRVLKMGDFSTELCGGTHAAATGEIGFFKIVGQSAVGAGTRRVEAVVGPEGMRYLKSVESRIAEVASKLNASPRDIVAKLDKYLAQVEKLGQEVESLKSRLMAGGASEAQEKIETIKGVKVLTVRPTIADKDLLRKLSDDMIAKVGSGIVVIGVSDAGTARLIVRVTPDLTKKYPAGKLIQKLAPIVGGKGGGRPDMAEAGGDQADKICEVFQRLPELL